MNVPFNRPVRLEGHYEDLAKKLASSQLAGNGAITRECEAWLERSLGAKSLLVTSATHALEMMALVARIQPGDEVIVPSFTFVSTANPFALRGARLRFADNDENGNILPSEVARLMTKKTKAVVVVDYAGASGDFDAINEICRENGVLVFEDAAQGVGATYKGRPMGTLGDLGCFSFHDTKNITSGEGGALILRDVGFLDDAEIIREKGTNRRKFLQGLVDKYTWVAVGSSYVMSELNAAYLLPQLEQLTRIQERRREICERYDAELRAAFARCDTSILETPAHNKPNYHMFAAIFPRIDLRNAFIAHMKSLGVTCPFHYVPLHMSPQGLSFYESSKPDELPGCERIASGLVRLPLFYNLTDDEQSYVIEQARAWLTKRS